MGSCAETADPSKPRGGKRLESPPLRVAAFSFGAHPRPALAPWRACTFSYFFEVMACPGELLLAGYAGAEVTPAPTHDSTHRMPPRLSLSDTHRMPPRPHGVVTRAPSVS